MFRDLAASLAKVDLTGDDAAILTAAFTLGFQVNNLV